MYAHVYVCSNSHLFMSIESNHKPTVKESNDHIKALKVPEDFTDNVLTEARRKKLESTYLLMCD